MSLEFSAWPPGSIEKFRQLALEIAERDGRLGPSQIASLKTLARSNDLAGREDEVDHFIELVLATHDLEAFVRGGEARPAVESPAPMQQLLTVPRQLKGSPDTAQSRLANWANARRLHEEAQSATVVYRTESDVQAGVNDFSDEARKQLEEQAAYERQMSGISATDTVAVTGYPRVGATLSDAPSSTRMFVRLPALGHGVNQATIIGLLKRDGDTVDVNEPLCEVSTGDVITELCSPSAGVVEFHVREGDVVSVSADLAVVSDPGQHSVEHLQPQPEWAPELQMGKLPRLDSQVADQPPKPGPGGLEVRSQHGGAVSSARESAEVQDATRRAAHVLSLAQRTADTLTSNAKDEADSIISAAHTRAKAILDKAQSKADDLQADAEQKHSETTGTINQQRVVLEGRLEQLRSFEREYRTRLTAYLDSWLEELAPPVASASRSALEGSLAELQSFERDYRAQLRRHLELWRDRFTGSHW
jgi:biotin carboxyl carrier protein/vacuolar-type H+-ATPase subunit H